jgi:hypothetical protein
MRQLQRVGIVPDVEVAPTRCSVEVPTRIMEDR